MHASYYYKAHACILVFDVTRKVTYTNLATWCVASHTAHAPHAARIHTGSLVRTPASPDACITHTPAGALSCVARTTSSPTRLQVL
jgi:hypothetical protein